MRLGFDVGGTKTDAVAVAPTGEVVARLRRPTGWGPEAVIDTVHQLALELAEAVGIDVGDFGSAGVGMPGQVAPGTARVTHAVNLGIDELDVGEALGARLAVPVAAENDVKAAALGAYALQDESDCIGYLNLGTGIAAGYVIDGELWRGSGGTAGEVGHLSIDPNGPACRCGQRGCVEAFAGGGAIAQRWGGTGEYPVRDVFDAADAGDERALALRASLAYGVASAVRILVLTGDVRTVVLGGGLTALGDRMLSLVRGGLDDSAVLSPFLRSLHLADRIRVLPPGSPAAALGAAMIGATAHEKEALAHG